MTEQSYEVTQANDPVRRLIGVQRSATMHTLGEVFMEGFDAVYAHLRANNVTDAGHNVAYYTDVRVEGDVMHFGLVIGVEVRVPVPVTDDVGMHATPGGPVATTAHWGDYSGLPAAHAAIQQWCQANGRSFGRNWEVYGDWSDDITKVRTDVYYELT